MVLHGMGWGPTGPDQGESNETIRDDVTSERWGSSDRQRETQLSSSRPETCLSSWDVRSGPAGIAVRGFEAVRPGTQTISWRSFRVSLAGSLMFQREIEACVTTISRGLG